MKDESLDVCVFRLMRGDSINTTGRSTLSLHSFLLFSVDAGKEEMEGQIKPRRQDSAALDLLGLCLSCNKPPIADPIRG